MMTSTARKDNLFFDQGSLIVGKWHRTKYTVVKQLGAGMIGTVYLCRAQGRLVALKISEQQMSMTTEVNVLKMLNKVQDCRLGPFLYEVDDWVAPNQMIYSFYVMEYIPGTRIDTYIKRRGTEWVIVLLVQLLDELEKVHQAGWVFGDLKKEHILIQESPLLIRCIDVGGMTKRGRSIKEYSEFYDRAYWQLGTRVAEPSYDLFAIVMIILSIYYPRQFKRQTTPRQDLFPKIAMIKELRIIHPILRAALEGKYTSAKAMKADIMNSAIRRQTSRKDRQKSTPSYFIQSFIVITIAAVYYGLSFLF